MKNKDKVLAAFLVSMGMFSALQATKYIASLSDADKNALVPAAAASNDGTVTLLCSTDWPDTNPKKA